MERSLVDSGLSGTTVVQAHRILHKALQDAVRWGVAWRNVASAVSPPKKSRREMLVLNAAELAVLLDAVGTSTFGHVIAAAAYTGMRRGELVGLQWRDIDLDRGTLSVQRSLQLVPRRGYVASEPKTSRSRRTITLGTTLVATFKRQRALQAENRLAAGPVWNEGGWVFTRPDGRPVDPTIVSRKFRSVVTELGLPPVRLHDLRHTHATLLLVQGVHPKVVQERLGHFSISITLDIYSHVLPGLQERAAAAFETALDTARLNRA